MAEYGENYPAFAKDPQQNIFSMNIYADYAYPTTGGGGAETSMFGSLGDQFSTVGDYVWDSVEGVWISTKSGLSSLVEGVGDAADSVMMKVVKYAAIGLIGLLLLIWVLGKSGVSGDLAKGVGAFFGAR